MAIFTEKYVVSGLGERAPTEVVLIIEPPQKCDFGYEVIVSLKPLFSDFRPFRGETAFNALQLAVIFISDLMSGYRKEGVEILAIGEDKRSIEAVFLKLGFVDIPDSSC